MEFISYGGGGGPQVAAARTARRGGPTHRRSLDTCLRPAAAAAIKTIYNSDQIIKSNFYIFKTAVLISTAGERGGAEPGSGGAAPRGGTTGGPGTPVPRGAQPATAPMNRRRRRRGETYYTLLALLNNIKKGDVWCTTKK